MSSVNVIFRPSLKAGSHPGSLSLRVVVNRKPKTVSTGWRLYPKEWDEERRAIRYPANDPQRSAYLRHIETSVSASLHRMQEIIRSLESRGRYTASEVIFLYRLNPDQGKLSGYAAALSAALLRSGQKRLSDAYGTVSRGLIAFNKGKDIPLSQINSTLIKEFEAHLKEHGKHPNTISYYMRNLRAIYNKAVSTGRIPEGEKPFAGVFTGVKETRKRALSAEQVSKLREIDFDKLLDEHAAGGRRHTALLNLRDARSLFFFCLYAQGMCFVDLCHLKKQHLKNGVVRYYRKKTGKQIEVPVNEGMKRIIRSFAARTEGSEYLFPILKEGDRNPRLRYETALRTQNRRLKKLSRLCGLDREIATHVARHSWASILKSRMQPVSVISEGLGHSSEKMTRRYLDSFEYSVLSKAGKTLLSAIARPGGDNGRSLFL